MPSQSGIEFLRRLSKPRLKRTQADTVTFSRLYWSGLDPPAWKWREQLPFWCATPCAQNFDGLIQLQLGLCSLTCRLAFWALLPSRSLKPPNVGLKPWGWKSG